MAEHRRRVVLVADDDRDITYLLGAQLEDAGYNVHEESTLRGLRTHLLTDPLPDLLVLDVKMGTEDASAFLADLRAAPRSATLPVLLISARVDVGAALHDGYTTALNKPFGMRTLLAAVAAALDQL